VRFAATERKRLPVMIARRLNAAEVGALRSELGVGSADYLIGGVGRLARSPGAAGPEAPRL